MLTEQRESFPSLIQTNQFEDNPASFQDSRLRLVWLFVAGVTVDGKTVPMLVLSTCFAALFIDAVEGYQEVLNY